MSNTSPPTLDNVSEAREKIISHSTVLLSNVIGNEAHDFLYRPINNDNVVVVDLIMACVFQLESVVESGNALEWTLDDLRTCIGMVLRAFVTEYYQIHKDDEFNVS